MIQSHERLEKINKYILGIICLIFGIIGVCASKGMTVLAILAGITGIGAWLRSAKPLTSLFTLPVMILIALLSWSEISAFWALDMAGAMKLGLRLALLILLGVFAIRLASEKQISLQGLVPIGYLLGLLTLGTGYAYAKTYGDSLWGSYFFDPLTTLNNGSAIMALLLCPVSVILWKQDRRVQAGFLIGIVLGALFFLSSGAAILAVMSAAVVFFLVATFGKPATITIGSLVALLTLTAPEVASYTLKSEPVYKVLSNTPPSVDHRVKMWEFVTMKISERPVLGHGMDASRHIPQDAYRLAPNMEIMPLHPHNAPLQIRLELGWPGSILAALFLFALFRYIARNGSDRVTLAMRAGSICAYLSIGAVSYGVWQNWWVSTALVLAMITEIASEQEDDGI